MTLTMTEIDSQPDVWRAALAYVPSMAHILRAPGERMLIVGCGTSAFMASSLAALREAAGLGETDWAFASDAPTRRRYDRVLALTRSGTTTEILRLLDPEASPLPDVRGDGGRTARRSVVAAVTDQPVAQFADDVLVLAEADEQSVVQTRFPTTTLLVARAALGEDVEGLVDQCRQALAAGLPMDVESTEHYVYLGSGWTLGLAHEAALKIREAAQAWAESYPALDYRHGPIAVAGATSLVWHFGSPDPQLAADVEATGATVVDGAAFARPLDPLVQLVLAQKLAVSAAVRRGLDPDRPRHLTRSVVLDARVADARVHPLLNGDLR